MKDVICTTFLWRDSPPCWCVVILWFINSLVTFTYSRHCWRWTSLEDPRNWVHLRFYEMKLSSLSTAWWSKKSTFLRYWKCAALQQFYTIKVHKKYGRNSSSTNISLSPRSHLSPPESQTLNEVCYYSSSATVRRHLNATPRISIQAALSSPYYYLQVRLPNRIKCVTILTWAETEILKTFSLHDSSCRTTAWRLRMGPSLMLLLISALHTNSIWSAAGWLTSTTG